MSAIFSIRTIALSLLPVGLAACTAPEWPTRSQVRADVENAQGGRADLSRSGQAFLGATAVVAGKGDTVYGLSRRHGVSMRAIIVANGLAPPFHLSVGQRIVLPRNLEHEGAKGDKLSQIANKRSIGMYDLARLNGLKPPYTIFVGQRLRLPDDSGSSIAAAGPGTVTTVSVSPQAANTSANASSSKTVRSQPRLPKKPPAWATAKRTVRAPVASKPVRTQAAAPRSVPKPAPRTSSGFLWPVQGRVISSYGAKAKGLRNDGINIAAPRGTPVRAAENGVVVYAGNELRGFGNLVLIKHAGGWVTAYAHTDQLKVQRGDKIKKGQRIATVGSTGNVTSPQLHFELRKGKRPRDPRKLLRRV